MTIPHLLDHDLPELNNTIQDWLAERKQPRYRSKQVLEHVFSGRELDPQEMKNLPGTLRAELTASLLRAPLTRDTVQESSDGTRKYRYVLPDGKKIESVWIPSGDRATLCISSQAGCPAACTFCATGAGGFFRNLTPSEILGQWMDVIRVRPVTQLVFMGMGEPLLNVRALFTALRTLTSAEGFAFSPRRITVSTVGIAPKMKALMTEFPQIRLALSLHSAVGKTRDQIVPFNQRHPLPVLRRTLQDLADQVRRVSLEYVVLRDVNDSEVEARALASFATDTAGHINLLPFHPYPGAPHKSASESGMLRFQELVEQSYHGSVTIRRSRGLDIAGACGQLALLDKGDG